MRRKRRAAFWVSGAFCLYVALYVLNSMSGGYRLYWVSTIHHPIDYEKDLEAKGNGGAMAWQPRFGSYTRFSSDAVGKIVSPLIFLDQSFWHPDIPAGAHASREDFEAAVPLHKVHPEDRKDYGRRDI